MNDMRSGSILSIAAFALLALPVGEAHAQYRGGSSYEALYDSEVTAALRSHIRNLSAIGLEGRAAGSEGEEAAAQYVGDVFDSYGIELFTAPAGDTFGVLREDGDTLTSRNVAAFIQGYDKDLKDKFIVIGARLDNLAPQTMTVDGEPVRKLFPGANGNASGLAMLLELGRRLKTNETLMRRSVLLVGFGASMLSNAGAWYFINRFFPSPEDIDAMINLDMLGTGHSGFYAYTCSNADMNNYIDELKATLEPVFPELTAQEPYPSDHRAFYGKGVPSVMFTTGQYPEYGTERDTESIIDYDSMEKELEYIYNYTMDVVNGATPIFSPTEEMRRRGTVSADVISYYDCDHRPTFMGSSDPNVFMQKWVYQYLKYPQAAVENGRQGRVLVDFVITDEGKVRDVRVLKGVDELLDAEAVRVISASPDWKPGRVRGQKVNTELSLYVEFRLQKKSARSFGIKK